MGFLPLGHVCLVNRLGILACIPFLNYREVGGASGIESACQCRRLKRCRFDAWVWEIPWARAWQPTPVFVPRESHGQRRLVGYSP